MAQAVNSPIDPKETKNMGSINFITETRVFFIKIYLPLRSARKTLSVAKSIETVMVKNIKASMVNALLRTKSNLGEIQGKKMRKIAPQRIDASVIAVKLPLSNWFFFLVFGRKRMIL